MGFRKTLTGVLFGSALGLGAPAIAQTDMPPAPAGFAWFLGVGGLALVVIGIIQGRRSRNRDAKVPGSDEEDGDLPAAG